ncbi:hypothetical protein [Gluconobacter roseus]|uniref:Uncharacterized protein n=1 Tax=Gluconobacter roseus NBRC 3990 TaxID=1307950 RepID=A0A4Y3M8W8_9PROT|nr:hypothetical protein [Gluconobacter roseus]KXV42874.1 hypothetical protein AD943_12580 [Gluconobacter roseus]GBR48830.1 hypothetical protein AA3990_2275 [Gluconobacter roseus NBRC 3990]GEB04356.1 hypothetical protein GRO01_19320 [Gluconobacter roseus NBRC 3990]GLP92799.1 hypothetical protein GCM10007871_07770 [Gluconobacter roseus NBRC 3990]
MTFTKVFSGLSLAALLAFGLSVAPAHALTAKDCHAAFKTAKQNGSLNGQSYKAFKAASCGDTSNAAAPAAASGATPTTTATPAAPATAAGPDSSPAGTKAPIAPKASVASSGNVVFPTAISPEFSKLSAGKARQKTCVAQYNANKANGGNGSLKWIQKGGGYWSQCNSRLKGE